MAACPGSRTPGAARRRRLLGRGLPKIPLPLLLLLACWARPAAAQRVYTVGTDADNAASPPPASLRAAIQYLSASAYPVNTIVFGMNSPVTIVLQAPLPDFQLGPNTTLVIDGRLTDDDGTPDRVTITTAGSERHLSSVLTAGSVLSLKNLVVRGITFKFSPYTGVEARNCLFSGAGKAPGRSLSLVYAGTTLLVEDSAFEDHTSYSAIASDNGATSIVVRRTTFARNTVDTSGDGLGAAIVATYANGPFVIDAANFYDCSCEIQGGAVYVSGASARVSITDSTFSGNTASGNGGAVIIQSAAEAVIQGSTFENSTSNNDGGCLIIDDTQRITVASSTFHTCSAGGIGGGLYIGNCPAAIVDGVQFLSCSAGVAGGAAINSAPNLRLTNSYAEGNSAGVPSSVSAGFAVIGDSAGAYVANLTARANTAQQGGTGGVLLRGCPLAVVRGSVFDGNTGGGAVAGGLYLLDSPGAQVTSCQFTNNNGVNGGGAGIMRCDRTTLTQSLFQGNSATQQGAALIIMFSANVTGTNLTLRSNSAAFPDGTGFSYFEGVTNGAFDDWLVEGNTANKSYGGIAAHQSTGIVFRRLMARNNDALSAPAFMALKGSDLTFIDSAWTDNTAPNIEGALVTDASIATLIRTLYARNGIVGIKVESGSTLVVRESTLDSIDGLTNYTLFIDDATADIRSSTIVAASSPGPLLGGGPASLLSEAPIFVQGNSLLALANTIVGCPDSECLINGGPTTGPPPVLVVKSSLLRGSWGAPGDGNIDSTSTGPLLGALADNGGPTQTRMPLAGSPAIDAGSNALLAADGYDDFDQRGPGFPRINCTVVDMGAVEAPFSAPTLYPGAVPAVFNTTRAAAVIVAAPGVVATSGPLQQFTGAGTFQAVLVSGPHVPGATLDLQPSGAFNYTPSKSHVDTDNFTVLARRASNCGVHSDSPPATFLINVLDIPPALANRLNFTTYENVPLTVAAPGLLAGSSDADGDPIVVAACTRPAHGSVTCGADGAFNYTPAASSHGPDAFNVTASDGFGGYATSTATIGVVNRPPYAVVNGVAVGSGQPAITISAFRNTPLVVPALGLLPSGQPLPPGTALFVDPENDTMTLTLVAPPGPGQGSATVAPGTGAVTFNPPFMAKTAPDGLTSSIVLQAKDAIGQVSPLLKINIVIGGEPPLGAPTINNFSMRVTSCKAGGISISDFSVTAGTLTLLDKTGAPAFPPIGGPSGIVVQARALGTLWPADDAQANKVPCVVKPPGSSKLASLASRSWDYGACPQCLKCLTFAGLDCTGPAPTWQIRVRAWAQPGAQWSASAWSAPFNFTPTCEGKALTCFTGP